MRIPQLATLLAMAALIGAPSMTALAEVPTQQTSTASASAAPSGTSETEQYAARESKDKSAANFKAGDEVVYIGIGSASVALVVLVVCLVVLL